MATVDDVLDRCKDQLMDESGVRWTQDELIRYVLDAQREIVNYKPDAIVVTATMDATGTTPDGGSLISAYPLRPGTKQELPATALRLLSLVRNNYSNATRSIRAVSRETLDRFVPGWHGVTAAQETKHFIYDENTPTVFYIYPQQPNPATGSIELVYTKNPNDINSSADSIEVADSYINAIVDYTLYRAFSKDGEVPTSQQRAATQYQAFITGLQGKQAVDEGTSPRVSPLNISPQ